MLKVKNSGFPFCSKALIALKPRTQPVKEVAVFAVYVIISLSTTLLFYALRRITQYEEVILNLQQIIEFSSDKMKLVDAKGHYESDDETGFFFEQLKQIQLSLDGIFEQETTDAKKEK